MRDSMGGLVTIVIIVVFIVFALGYMAFNVNYTKAFRMKDKIISTYDDYNGNCDARCEQEIVNYANQIGYSSGTGTGGTMSCIDSDYSPKLNLYCEHNNEVVKEDGSSQHYYDIVTRINMEVPIFKNVLNFRFFYIFGSTETYKD